MEITMSNFSTTLKELRNARGLTQKQLAQSSGILETTIRKYELGSIKPRTDNLQRLASALGVDITQLIDPQINDTPLWISDIQVKFRQIGISVDFSSDEGLTIICPDGSIAVSPETLQELDASVNSYMRFKLAELKEQHPDNFFPKRGGA